MFLCMTRCLNVPYKCMKFCCIISDGYQVTERTPFCDRQTHEQMQGGNIHARVMVLVHDMLPECGLP